MGEPYRIVSGDRTRRGQKRNGGGGGYIRPGCAWLGRFVYVQVLFLGFWSAFFSRITTGQAFPAKIG